MPFVDDEDEIIIEHMRTNRSMPSSSVIPVLNYPDVPAAVDWLCAAFGFSLRWQLGTHRAQLNVGNGCVVAAEGKVPAGAGDHSVMIRVEDAKAHCVQARAYGARILNEPEDYPYGERQYNALDLAGHRWTFSESIADVDPQNFGAKVGQL